MRNVLLAAVAALSVAAPASATITQVDYSSLTGAQQITDFNYSNGLVNSAVYQNGVEFDEHFAGQIVTVVNGSDVISGLPTSLDLVAGAPNANLAIGPHMIIGIAPNNDGDPAPGGAVSLLFSSDQSQFGVGYVGSNPGGYAINFSFFGADGSLIQTLTLPTNTNNINDGAEVRYGFLSDASNIRGVSIWNNDLGGIGFDNFRFDTPSTLSAVPEPAMWAMMVLGFGAIGAMQRRQSRLQVA